MSKFSIENLLKKRFMLVLGLSKQQASTAADIVSDTLYAEMLQEEEVEEDTPLRSSINSGNRPAIFNTYLVNDGMSILCISQGPSKHICHVAPKIVLGSVTCYGDDLHFFLE